MKLRLKKLSTAFIFCYFGIFSYAQEESSSSAPKMEHIGMATSVDYLDGPAVQGFGSDKGRIACNDKEGNVFFMWKYSGAWIRCITAGGQLETIGGDNRWATDLKLKEGPASYIPTMFAGGGAGATCFPEYGLWAEGTPLKGEDEGCVYVFWKKRSPYKLYKNKEKDGRWWFQLYGDSSKSKPVAEIGKTYKISETNLTSAMIGNKTIYLDGNLYDHDSAEGTMTCLLTKADYVDKATKLLDADHRDAKRKIGKSAGPAEHMARADDGSFYFLYYLKNYAVGSAFRMSADRSKIDFLVQHDQNIGTNGTDGLGRHTKWHAGPAWMRMTGNILMLRAVDSATARRYKDGRVSVLCTDGEWRETWHKGVSERDKLHVITSSGYQPGDHNMPYIYIHYAGEKSGNDARYFRFGPVDYEKATVGALNPDPMTKEGK